MDFERWREPITVLPSEETLRAKREGGWSPVAIEWARLPASRGDDDTGRPIPYGFRISADCAHLEVDPVEKEVMSLVVAWIADDRPLSKVATELNRRDYRNREGEPWTQVSLFRLLPRIVEFGPEILSSETWADSKRRFLRAVTA